MSLYFRCITCGQPDISTTHSPSECAFYLHNRIESLEIRLGYLENPSQPAARARDTSGPKQFCVKCQKPCNMSDRIVWLSEGHWIHGACLLAVVKVQMEL